MTKLCPECGHVFQGSGFTGIDSHWKAQYSQIMPYADAWALIKAATYSVKYRRWLGSIENGSFSKTHSQTFKKLHNPLGTGWDPLTARKSARRVGTTFL